MFDWASLAGGATGGGTSSTKSNALKASLSTAFDSSNWTVSTGNSSASGGTSQPVNQLLYVGAGIVGLIIVGLIVKGMK